MANRREHNRRCVDAGIPHEVCDPVNKRMDALSKRFPGCEHRKYRHSEEYCEKLVRKQDNPEVARQKYLACQVHIEVDKNEGSCE